MKHVLFLSALLLSFTAKAQQGKWAAKGNDPSFEYECLTITKDTSEWMIAENQLDVEFRTRFKKDTAFLSVIYSDCGRTFMGPKAHPPKDGELFAKCYLVNKKKLHIIYFDKKFVREARSVKANIPDDMYLKESE